MGARRSRYGFKSFDLRGLPGPPKWRKLSSIASIIFGAILSIFPVLGYWAIVLATLEVQVRLSALQGSRGAGFRKVGVLGVYGELPVTKGLQSRSIV